MEYEKIKQLMDDMGNSKLTSLDIEFPDGIKIKMEKKQEEKIVVNTEKILDDEESKNLNKSNSDENTDNKPVGKIVKSPMIGTFYSKPSPDSVPFVEVGSNVKKGSVLCIIEAMKLMNEIESEFEGKIEEIYVKDGDAVDFGKPLFKII